MALVLVVDDDDEVRSMLGRVMKRQGYQVLEAFDGVVAAALMQQKEVDLMITDLLMPNKEGLELIQEVKEKQPRVKIIAYSGGGKVEPESYLEFAKGMGADEVFTKPVPLSELIHTVDELIGSNTVSH